MIKILFVLGLSVPALAEYVTLPATLEKRCNEQRQFGSCYEVSDLYEMGGQKLEGEKFLLSGCHLEKQRACNLEEANLARKAHLKSKKDWIEAAEKVIHDESSPKTKDELECEGGNAKSCLMGATHFRYLAPMLNPKRAVKLLEEGCRLGNAESCDTLRLERKGIIHVYDVEM